MTLKYYDNYVPPSTNSDEQRGRKPSKPNALLDALKVNLGLRSDKALAHELGFTTLMITKYRTGRGTPTDDFLLWAHIKTGWNFTYLRELRDAKDDTGNLD